VLAAVCAAAGGITLAVAVLATQGAWYAGYVSEAGVAGEPYRNAYRLGIFGMAAALLLLAAAVNRLAVLPAVVLLASGLLAGVSGTVSCSPGCPLPPFETPTAADLVHGGTSVAGVALCGLAVLLLALGRVDTDLRRVSRAAVGPVVALGIANAYGLAFVGRGHLTGIAERVMLLVIVAWIVAAALSLALVPSQRPGRRERSPHPA
jgi:hypothetical protein